MAAGISATAWAAIGAISSLVMGGTSAYMQNQNAKKAAGQAEDQAALQQQQANRANAKNPNANALLAAAQMASKSGAAGTMLTGPSGVNAGSMQLGKTTLLGQ